MAQVMRFGRKIALPSTRQIIHELRVLAAEDARRRAAATPAGADPETLATPLPPTTA